jgi:formate dehydrogenase major subunit
VPASIVPPAEEPDAEFPLVLTTGRQLEHWHTGSMTRRSSVLDDLEPEAVAYVSSADLRKLGLKAGDRIRVSTRRGAIELKARVDGAMPTGLVFIPFCYAEAAANILTNPQLDPFGKIPEFKYCAARIEPAQETVPMGEAAE